MCFIREQVLNVEHNYHIPPQLLLQIILKLHFKIIRIVYNSTKFGFNLFFIHFYKSAFNFL